MATVERRLCALRGAITAASDTPEEIVAVTRDLLGAMIERNEIEIADLVSIVFTSTPDLRSEFPAAGARELGLAGVPLLCAQEIDVPGAVPLCIRVLIHLYTERDYASLRHVYLGGAQHLRTDLPS